MYDLIEQLYHGVMKGEIQQPFTSHEFKEWVHDFTITKQDGSSFEKSSLEALLSNSAKHNRGSSNLNRKVLNATTNAHGKQMYWFDGIEM